MNSIDYIIDLNYPKNTLIEKVEKSKDDLIIELKVKEIVNIFEYWKKQWKMVSLN